MTVTDPFVSIIIPVYNGANYMREAIDSALAQTYSMFEVIVVNDGSRDQGETLRIAESYGTRIRLIDKPNGGVATALNTGIEAAKGEYISWLSHDDVYPIHKLQMQIDSIKKMGEPTAVFYGDYDVIDDAGHVIDSKKLGHYKPENIFIDLLCDTFINGCALLIPKKIFDDIGGFDPALPTTQDYDLWIRMAQKYPFLYTPGIVLHSRAHAEQGSRKPQHLIELHAFYDQHLGLLTSDWLGQQFKGEALKIAYKRILARCASAGWGDHFQRMYRQALQHVFFKNAIDKAQFSISCLAILAADTARCKIKSALPVPLKNNIKALWAAFSNPSPKSLRER